MPLVEHQNVVEYLAAHTADATTSRSRCSSGEQAVEYSFVVR
jgi:hypothetical protein